MYTHTLEKYLRKLHPTWTKQVVVRPPDVKVQPREETPGLVAVQASGLYLRVQNPKYLITGYMDPLGYTLKTPKP